MDGSFETPINLEEELKNCRTKFPQLLSEVKPFLMNDQLMRRCRVSELVGDPDWEETAEDEISEAWLPDDDFDEDWDYDEYLIKIVREWNRSKRERVDNTSDLRDDESAHVGNNENTSDSDDIGSDGSGSTW